MLGTDLKGARRISIGLSLVLLLYAFAGVQIDAARELSLFGVPITLRHARAVPWALAGASIYGALTFWFYGMRRKSTWVVRRDIQREFESNEAKLEKQVATREDVLWWINRIDHSYAGVADGGSHENEDESWTLWITPPRSRIPSLFRDIDYSAPVWLTCLALLAVTWRFPYAGPAAQPDSDRSVPTLELVSTTALPAFRPASSENPDGSLRTQICLVRDQFEALEVSAAVVVGYHDFRELSIRSRTRHPSNASLAQERADSVSKLLRDATICRAPPLSSVLGVVAGPRIGPLDVRGLSGNVLDAATIDDRRVEVHGLWQRRSSGSAQSSR